MKRHEINAKYDRRIREKCRLKACCSADLYYLKARTHLALSKDTPEPRAIQPPELGVVVEYPEVGGLHHRYERRAA
jgi:hypothetical protein